MHTFVLPRIFCFGNKVCHCIRLSVLCTRSAVKLNILLGSVGGGVFLDLYHLGHVPKRVMPPMHVLAIPWLATTVWSTDACLVKQS